MKSAPSLPALVVFLLFLVAMYHSETATPACGHKVQCKISAKNNISVLRFYVGFLKRYYVDFSRDFMIFEETLYFLKGSYVDSSFCWILCLLKNFYVGEVSINH